MSRCHKCLDLEGQIDRLRIDEKLTDEERMVFTNPSGAYSGMVAHWLLTKVLRMLDRDAATLERVRAAVSRSGRMWPPGEQPGLDRCVELMAEALAGVGTVDPQERNGITIDQAREAWEQIKREIDAANTRIAELLCQLGVAQSGSPSASPPTPR